MNPESVIKDATALFTIQYKTGCSEPIFIRRGNSRGTISNRLTFQETTFRVGTV